MVRVSASGGVVGPPSPDPPLVSETFTADAVANPADVRFGSETRPWVGIGSLSRLTTTRCGWGAGGNFGESCAVARPAGAASDADAKAHKKRITVLGVREGIMVGDKRASIPLGYVYLTNAQIAPELAEELIDLVHSYLK